MKLCDVFTRAVVTARPDEPLSAVATKMREHNVGAVVVVDKERPVGIITDRDVALALGTRGVTLQAPVREVMTPHVLAIPEDTGILAATTFMRSQAVRRLPIVDREDRVVGLVSLDDLLLLLARELNNLAEGVRAEVKAR